MLRIHFGMNDLTRIRITDSVGPVLESIYALDLMGGKTGAALPQWQRDVRLALGPHAREVDQLLSRYRPLPDLLWVTERENDKAASVTSVVARDRNWAAGVVLSFCRQTVMPRWTAIQSYLRGDRERRGRAFVEHGIDGLLRSLHPRATWNPPVLEILGSDEREVHLGGRGLSVKVAFFLGRAPHVIDIADSAEAPMLITPAADRGALLSIFADPFRSEEQALGELVGHTRAAALQVIAGSCTTGQLSARLGISLAGASKHAKILREAGLVSTTRSRNTGLHTLTSLGVELLKRGAEAGAR